MSDSNKKKNDELEETTCATIKFSAKATKIIRRKQADRLLEGKPPRGIPWIVNQLIEREI